MRQRWQLQQDAPARPGDSPTAAAGDTAAAATSSGPASPASYRGSPRQRGSLHTQTSTDLGATAAAAAAADPAAFQAALLKASQWQPRSTLVTQPSDLAEAALQYHLSGQSSPPPAVQDALLSQAPSGAMTPSSVQLLPGSWPPAGAAAGLPGSARAAAAQQQQAAYPAEFISQALQTAADLAAAAAEDGQEGGRWQQLQGQGFTATSLLAGSPRAAGWGGVSPSARARAAAAASPVEQLQSADEHSQLLQGHAEPPSGAAAGVCGQLPGGSSLPCVLGRDGMPLRVAIPGSVPATPTAQQRHEQGQQQGQQPYQRRASSPGSGWSLHVAHQPGASSTCKAAAKTLDAGPQPGSAQEFKIASWPSSGALAQAAGSPSATQLRRVRASLPGSASAPALNRLARTLSKQLSLKTATAAELAAEVTGAGAQPSQEGGDSTAPDKAVLAECFKIAPALVASKEAAAAPSITMIKYTRAVEQVSCRCCSRPVGVMPSCVPRNLCGISHGLLLLKQPVCQMPHLRRLMMREPNGHACRMTTPGRRSRRAARRTWRPPAPCWCLQCRCQWRCTLWAPTGSRA